MLLKKSKYLNISFACTPGKGSENQLGFIYSISDGGSIKITFCPEFEFMQISSKVRTYKKIIFKKKNKSIYIKFGKLKKKPIFERIVYQYWIISFFLYFLFFVKKDKKLHFVTYNQVLTFNPFHLFYRKNALFGPIGGQPVLFNLKFISLKKRLTNFLVQYLYIICSYNLVKKNEKNFFCHPKLSKRFNSNSFFPIINLGDLNKTAPIESYKKFIKRNNILFIGKNLEIKLPNIVNKVFKKMSSDNENFNFIMIGPGFENNTISKNFKTKSSIEREAVLKLFSSSYLHIFISLELGGFVTAESAYNFCPNFISKDFGADLVFNNSNDFSLKINEKTTSYNLQIQLYDKLSALLKNPKKVFKESIRQKEIIESQNIYKLNSFLDRENASK
jgi:hypothetical protein